MVLTAALLLLGLLEPAEAGDPAGAVFMDIPWGATLAEVRRTHELERTSTRGPEEQYATDITEWAGAQLSMCELEFTRGRFSGVVIIIRGREGTSRILRRMTSLLGAPFPNHTNPPPGTGPCGYQWLTAETHLTLDEDHEENAYLYWYSLRYAASGDRLFRAGGGR